MTLLRNSRVLGSIPSTLKSSLPFQSQSRENSCSYLGKAPYYNKRGDPRRQQDLLLTVGIVFLLYLLTTGNANLYAIQMEICKHEDWLAFAQLLNNWPFRKYGNNHDTAVSSIQGQLQLCESRQKDAAETSTKTISAAKQL